MKVRHFGMLMHDLIKADDSSCNKVSLRLFVAFNNVDSVTYVTTEEDNATILYLV